MCKAASANIRVIVQSLPVKTPQQASPHPSDTMTKTDRQSSSGPCTIMVDKSGRRPRQRSFHPLNVFDFSRSQISPAYMDVLDNTLRRPNVQLWHQSGAMYEMYGPR